MTRWELQVGERYLYKKYLVELVALCEYGAHCAQIREDNGDEFWVRPDQLSKEPKPKMTREERQALRDSEKLSNLKASVDWQLLAWLRDTGYKFHGEANEKSVGRVADLFAAAGQSFDESLINIVDGPTSGSNSKKWTFSLNVRFKKPAFSVPSARELEGGNVELNSNDTVLALMANGLVWN